MPAMSDSSSLLIDTHVWVRYINGTPGLKPAAVHSIESARRTGSAFISVISIWEIALLVRKGRLGSFPSALIDGFRGPLNCQGFNLHP